jgi:glycosyltransferase involved in cell wall biosynthesis
MPAILLVCGFKIFPVNTGGHLRTASIARALTRMGHTVLIYSLAGRNEDYGLRNLRSANFHIENIEPRLSEETNLGMGFGSMQTLFRRLGRPRFWQHALLRLGIVPGRLKIALREADIVISDMPWIPVIPGPWSLKPWFMLSHNLEYRLLEQGDAKHRRFADWMREVEKKAALEFRDIFACAEEDRDFFLRQDSGGTRQLPIIRCGVDPAAYEVPVGTRERLRRELGVADDDRILVFSGSRFAPNLEALAVLQEFCRTQAAFLRQQRIYLLVLGSISPAAFRADRFIVTGRVPEVVPYLAAADVGLNAVTRGSGANVKLFEYLAARLPIISTAFGVRGTSLAPDTDFLLYDSPNLKEAIIRFLERDRGDYWRRHAEGVWARHRDECDIQEMVRAAVSRFPEFQ